MSRPTIPAPDRFIRMVNIAGDRECWEWMGGTSGGGYGKFRDGNSVIIGAHRFAYLLWKGPLRESEVVMHVCDNPPCVNPYHLRQSTQMDNVADRVAKGRGKGGRPSRSI